MSGSETDVAVRLVGGVRQVEQVLGFSAACRTRTLLTWNFYSNQSDVLMHAMGANTAGQLGSVIAGGVLLTLVTLLG